jgi:hypothetical protein
MAVKQKNNILLPILVALLLMIFIISSVFAYAYFQKSSFNLFGKSVGFGSSSSSVENKKLETCKDFDYSDNFGDPRTIQNMSLPEKGATKNYNILEITLLNFIKNLTAVSYSYYARDSYPNLNIIASKSNQPVSQNKPVESKDLTAEDKNALIGTPIVQITEESYKLQRLPVIAFANLKDSKLENLTKKEFLLSLDCSIVSAPEESLKQLSENNIDKSRFLDKKLAQERIDKSKTATDDQLETMLTEKSQDYNKYLSSEAISTVDFNVDFVAMFKEVSPLAANFKQIKALGVDDFLKSFQEKQDQEYSKIVKISDSQFVGNNTKIEFVNNDNYIVFSKDSLSEKDQNKTQTNLILNKIDQGKISAIWSIPKRRLVSITLSSDKQKIYAIEQLTDGVSSSNWNYQLLTIDSLTGEILDTFFIDKNQPYQFLDGSKPQVKVSDNFSIPIDPKPSIYRPDRFLVTSEGSVYILGAYKDIGTLLFNIKTKKVQKVDKVEENGFIFNNESMIFSCAQFPNSIKGKLEARCAVVNLKTNTVEWEKNFSGDRSFSFNISLEKANTVAAFVESYPQKDKYISYDIETKKEFETVENLNYYKGIQNLEAKFGVVNISNDLIARRFGEMFSTISVFKVSEKKLTIKKTFVTPEGSFDEGYAFSPDGKYLTLSTRGKTHLVDLAALN